MRNPFCVGAVSFVLVGCSALGEGIAPTLPPASPVPTISASALTWTIDASIGPVLSAANRILPKCSPGPDYCDNLIIQCEGAWANKSWWAPLVFGGGLKYSVWRWNDLQTNLSGNRIGARQPILYHAKAAQARGWPNPWDWTTIGSCGYGEPARTAVVGIDTTLNWDFPRWRLRTETTSYAGEIIPGCQISFINVDVTDKIKDALKKQMDSVAGTIDRYVPIASDATIKATDVWSKMQDPRKILGSYWLVLNPQKAYVSNVLFNGDHVRLSAAVSAAPRIVHGSMPSVQKTPLPDLQQIAVNSKMHIRAEAYLSLERLLDWLKRSATGSYIFLDPSGLPSKYQINVTDIVLSGRGDKLLVKATGKGGIWPFDTWGLWGDYYLMGVLKYDARTNMLMADNLTFSDETKKRLIDAGYRSVVDEFPKQLAAKFQLAIGNEMRKMKSNLERSFNTNMGGDVVLKGSVDDISPVTVRFSNSGIRIIVEFSGGLEVDVRLPENAIAVQPMANVCPD